MIRQRTAGTVLQTAALSQSAKLAAEASPKRPNILFIVVDDQDFAAIGAYSGNVLTRTSTGWRRTGSVSPALTAPAGPARRAGIPF